MDDLDHSIHISEYDWSSFYEESEECVLLQPSLACPDDSGLSDSEDSGNVGLVLGTGQRDTQQSPGVNSHRDDSNHSKKQERQGGAGAQDDETQAELCLKAVHAVTEEDNTGENHDTATNTLQTVDFQSTGESQEGNKNRNVQTESDLEHAKEPDPLSRSQTGLNVNELLATERDVSEAGSNFPRSVEKERWFVTVNENPTRTRERAAVKKKRRQKRPCDGSRTCSPTLQKSFEKDVDVNEESEGKKKAQLIQNFAKTSGAHPSYEINAESDQVQVDSDSSQLVETCDGGENVASEKLLIIDSPKEHMLETKTDRNNHESGSSVPTPQDTVTPSQLARAESEELDDSADFLSTHSYDSESYLSAAESVEEHQAPAEENQLLHSSLSPTSDNRQLFSVSQDADTSDPQLYSCDNVFLSNVAATDHEGCESSVAELSLTFPSAGERAPKMLADHTTCNNNIHSTTLCMTPDTSAAQNHQKALSVTNGDQLIPSPVPSLTITSCSTADSPEAYAQAAGHIRPVYAISAFWDEMEKLTINDILRLKMGRSTPPRQSQELAPQSADGSPRGPASLDDAVECSLSDGGLMDTSDAADSDYFTQPDEFKPDRSSCEFSTSDFEEEYWQFLSASRNPSPDPGSKTPDINPSFFPHEEECASSEGKQTPVPSEDSAGRWFDDQESRALTEPAEPRQIMKSKSMHNVHALNTDSLLFPSFGSNEESSVFLNRCQSLDENVVLKVSDSFQTLNSMLYFDNVDLLDACHQISFPEVYEDLFKEDKANTTSQCVKVYDPEEISVAPFFDFPLSALSDEISSSSLGCNKEQPIPIFSSSHPTVRDLTFPKLHFAFFSSNRDGAADISPMRFMSQPYLQDDQHGPCNWKSFLAIRKIHFHDKGSIRCGRSGVWLFPAEEEKILIREEDPTATVLSEGGVCPASSQLLKEFKEQRRVLESIQTKQEGMFSTLKQSDMCLVCIAFASWVLKSSDPEATDAWKAALLANVSALSAIRYLRQYVKKKKTNPLQDEC